MNYKDTYDYWAKKEVPKFSKQCEEPRLQTIMLFHILEGQLLQDVANIMECGATEKIKTEHREALLAMMDKVQKIREEYIAKRLF